MTAFSPCWPAAQGYRMPPEWAQHEATWLSWPHNRKTWPGCFDAVEPAMVEVVAALAPTEWVYINVLNEAHEAHVRGLLDATVGPDRVRYFRIPTNDAWVRDHGPILLLRDETDPPLALDFGFNSWGGKYPPFDKDAKAAALMASALGISRFVPGVVLEGGSIDVNGEGAVLTTEQCLLNPNRNPQLDRSAIETLLARTLGATQVIWLGEGIVGDDTDGHVDDLTRFVAADAVVTAIEPNADDPNHGPLRINRERLDAVEIAGKRLRVIELPSPEPQYLNRHRLPASYANFYIANGVVLMPTFACSADREAAEVLGACFPERRIVGIDCRALVGGLGALHCLTQQVPAAGAGP